VRFIQLLSAPFLVALETQIFVNNLRNWWSTDPPTSREISLTVRWLWVCLPDSATATTVSTFLSVCAASAAAQKSVDSSELHQQPVDAVLRPTFVQKLCYKLPSVVTFIFLQTFWLNVVFFTERHQSCRICLLQCQNSRYFSVSNLKDEKLIKKQTYMKTETCKLYSRDFWIFLPNTIKIDPYNFELYRFKVGPFFETQCTFAHCLSLSLSAKTKRQYVLKHLMLVAPCTRWLCFGVLQAMPVLLRSVDHYSSDGRIIERLFRCFRYAIRCLGSDHFDLFDPVLTKVWRLLLV